MRDQNLMSSSLSRSRAALCEIMATRLLRLYGDNILELAFVTTTSWKVYSGADEELLKRTFEDLELDDVEERVGNALEMAIISRAKRFIKSSACQKVIDSIWRYGRLFPLIPEKLLLTVIFQAVNVYIKHRAVTPFFPMSLFFSF